MPAPLLRRMIGTALAVVLAAEPVLAADSAQDSDERGLLMRMDEAERDLKASPAVIRDPEVNAYVHQVLCRTVGQDECGKIRLYLVRTPYFNANMAPNGAMQIWSGMLLRVENEAQLAAVLGHEYTHYKDRHSIELFRETRAKSGAATWLSFTGIGLIASVGLIGSLSNFSREMETEADLGGLELMAKAGYDTREAAAIWERLRAEMDATAAARLTSSKKDSGGLFASHPPTKERLDALRAAAAANPGTPGETGTERFHAAMAKVWPDFIDDQLKLNDFGASDYLLTSLGRDGWTAPLLYARGELYRRKGTPEANSSAVSFYTRAIDGGAGIAELWRGRGLAELKLGNSAAGRADLREYVARAPGAGDVALMTMLAEG